MSRSPYSKQSLEQVYLSKIHGWPLWNLVFGTEAMLHNQTTEKFWGKLGEKLQKVVSFRHIFMYMQTNTNSFFFAVSDCNWLAPKKAGL